MPAFKAVFVILVIVQVVCAQQCPINSTQLECEELLKNKIGSIDSHINTEIPNQVELCKQVPATLKVIKKIEHSTDKIKANIKNHSVIANFDQKSQEIDNHVRESLKKLHLQNSNVDYATLVNEHFVSTIASLLKASQLQVKQLQSENANLKKSIEESRGKECPKCPQCVTKSCPTCEACKICPTCPIPDPCPICPSGDCGFYIQKWGQCKSLNEQYSGVMARVSKNCKCEV